MVNAFAVAASLASALALYAGSRHCRPAWLQPLRRFGTALGAVLGMAALAAWIALLGMGAGLCVMLASWMVGLVAAPWLGQLGRASAARART